MPNATQDARHGPSHWEGPQGQYEFGFFVDHFTILAGLLYAAVQGPGERLAVHRGFIWKGEAEPRLG